MNSRLNPIQIVTLTKGPLSDLHYSSNTEQFQIQTSRSSDFEGFPHLNGLYLDPFCNVFCCLFSDEADRYIKMGILNAIFVFGRSAGLIGHYIDQRRLGITPLS